MEHPRIVLQNIKPKSFVAGPSDWANTEEFQSCTPTFETEVEVVGVEGVESDIEENKGRFELCEPFYTTV